MKINISASPTMKLSNIFICVVKKKYISLLLIGVLILLNKTCEMQNKHLLNLRADYKFPIVQIMPSFNLKAKLLSGSYGSPEFVFLVPK